MTAVLSRVWFGAKWPCRKVFLTDRAMVAGSWCIRHHHPGGAFLSQGSCPPTPSKVRPDSTLGFSLALWRLRKSLHFAKSEVGCDEVRIGT